MQRENMQLEGHDLLEICEVAPALLILVHLFSGSTSAFLISLNCNGSQLRHFSMMPNRAHDTYLNCDGTACAIRKFANRIFTLLRCATSFLCIFLRFSAACSQNPTTSAHGKRWTGCLPQKSHFFHSAAMRVRAVWHS